MSWQTKSVMEQKERFIRMCLSGDFTMKGLCESFGISRTTGYILVNGYTKFGESCFESKSKKPITSPNKTPQRIEDKVIELRNKHPSWGVRKFGILLTKYYKKK